MKRNKNLVLLSHDHFNGLTLANLIKKGAPVFSRLPNDIPGKLRYTLNAYDSEIKQHFLDEEEILFPAVEGRDPEIDKLIEQVLEEHCRIRDLISALRVGIETEENLNRLGSMLEKHIRTEERILFNKIETVLEQNELEELGTKIIFGRKSL
jgi:iron-sulfur cluster repair protein YtfE (RIC family)